MRRWGALIGTLMLSCSMQGLTPNPLAAARAWCWSSVMRCFTFPALLEPPQLPDVPVWVFAAGSGCAGSPRSPQSTFPTHEISLPKASPHPNTSHPTPEPQTIGTDPKGLSQPMASLPHSQERSFSPPSPGSALPDTGNRLWGLLWINGPTGAFPMAEPWELLHELQIPAFPPGKAQNSHFSLSLENAHSGSWGKSRVRVGIPQQGPGCIPAFPVGMPLSTSCRPSHAAQPWGHQKGNPGAKPPTLF